MHGAGVRAFSRCILFKRAGVQSACQSVGGAFRGAHGGGHVECGRWGCTWQHAGMRSLATFQCVSAPYFTPAHLSPMLAPFPTPTPGGFLMCFSSTLHACPALLHTCTSSHPNTFRVHVLPPEHLPLPPPSHWKSPPTQTPPASTSLSPEESSPPNTSRFHLPLTGRVLPPEHLPLPPPSHRKSPSTPFCIV
eukprot:364101-Chlamydomonas_euryale.AAC.6